MLTPPDSPPIDLELIDLDERPPITPRDERPPITPREEFIQRAGQPSLCEAVQKARYAAAGMDRIMERHIKFRPSDAKIKLANATQALSRMTSMCGMWLLWRERVHTLYTGTLRLRCGCAFTITRPRLQLSPENIATLGVGHHTPENNTCRGRARPPAAPHTHTRAPPLRRASDRARPHRSHRHSSSHTHLRTTHAHHPRWAAGTRSSSRSSPTHTLSPETTHTLTLITHLTDMSSIQLTHASQQEGGSLPWASARPQLRRPSARGVLRAA